MPKEKKIERGINVIRIVSFEFSWFSTFLKDKSYNIQTNDNMDFANLTAYLGAKCKLCDTN